MKNNRAHFGFLLLFLLTLFSIYQDNQDYRETIKRSTVTLERELKDAGMASEQVYAISDALEDIGDAVSSRRSSDFFFLLMVGVLFGFAVRDRRDGQSEDDTHINQPHTEGYVDRSPRPPFPG